jgi:hypothetical protein
VENVNDALEKEEILIGNGGAIVVGKRNQRNEEPTENVGPVEETKQFL